MHHLLPILPPVFAALFLAVLFLQSAFDKLLDYKGNFDYFTEHFSKSPLKNSVRSLLPVLMILELCSGLVCATGGVMGALNFVRLLMHGDYIDWIGWCLVTGFCLSCITFLALFFGQRVAKDYAGAVSIASYFIIPLAGLYFLVH